MDKEKEPKINLKDLNLRAIIINTNKTLGKGENKKENKRIHKKEQLYISR